MVGIGSSGHLYKGKTTLKLPEKLQNMSDERAHFRLGMLSQLFCAV